MLDFMITFDPMHVLICLKRFFSRMTIIHLKFLSAKLKLKSLFKILKQIFTMLENILLTVTNVQKSQKLRWTITARKMTSNKTF